MKILPSYNLDKIKYATDGPTFEKAVGLYESHKVIQFREEIGSYSAIVLGTKPYRVSVNSRHYDLGFCECYLGQNDTLCKHMVAVAIYAVMRGKRLTDEDKKLIGGPTCNGRLGTLSKNGLAVAKKAISGAMKYIKPYHGPSRIWFVYQNSLSEGCSRLSEIISDFPVNRQTAELLVDILLKLDDKLCRGGIDDSDGTVGGFIEESVSVLEEYARLDPSCADVFGKLRGKETSFGWERPLLRLLQN